MVAAPDFRAGSRSNSPLSTPNHPGDTNVYRTLARVCGAVFRATIEETWDDATQLPVNGGVLVVANHVTNLDTLMLGRYLIWSGRWPRYLGKAELWKVPGIGWLGDRCGQIPVHRGTDKAADSLQPAKQALREGQCVAIFPEGHRTTDPGRWPDPKGRTGAARLALATGVPVVPVAHWGTHEIFPTKGFSLPRLWPRKHVEIKMGDPVDLGGLDDPDDREQVREATQRIMVTITSLVAELRGEPAPAC